MVSTAVRRLATRGTHLTAVAIAPDLGERYIESIYHCDWVMDHYGEDALRPRLNGTAKSEHNYEESVGA